MDCPPRSPRGQRTILWPLMLSILLHLSLMALFPATEPPRDAFAAVTVDLVAAPPPPEPVPPPPPPLPVTTAAAAPVPAAPLRRPAPITAKRPPAPTAAPTEPAAAVAPFSPLSPTEEPVIEPPAPETAAAASPTATGSSDYAMTVWRHAMAFRPRRASRAGNVTVTFAIAADGSLSEAPTVPTDADPVLGALALDTVRRAAPFPPPPAGSAAPQRHFAIPFQFH